MAALRPPTKAGASVFFHTPRRTRRSTGARRPGYTDSFSAKLAMANSSESYTSNTNDSLVMTKMF